LEQTGEKKDEFDVMDYLSFIPKPYARLQDSANHLMRDPPRRQCRAARENYSDRTILNIFDMRDFA
jgi:hypothetical protein